MNAVDGTSIGQPIELTRRLNSVDVANYGRLVILILDRSLPMVDMLL